MKLKRLLCLSLFSLLACSSHTKENSAHLEKIRAKYNLPGLSSYIVGNEKSLSVTGIRRQGFSEKIKTQDIFHLGSCTKPMTATLIAILVEKGFLSWSQKMEDIFPELSMSESFKKVTIEQLTSHTSGIHGDMIKYFGRDDFNKLREFDDRPNEGRDYLLFKLSQEDIKSPGVYLYSNAGFAILGSVIDKVLNSTWEKAIQKYIFKPLDMKSCGFGIAATNSETVTDQPWGHFFYKDEHIPAYYDNPLLFNSAGTVHCTLKDWGKFVEIFAKKETKLLSEKAFQKLYETPKGLNVTYASMGKMMNEEGIEYLSAAGSNSFNYALSIIDLTNKKAYLSATNTASPEASVATEKIIKDLMKQ